MPPPPSLEEQILAALERALVGEGQAEADEHLLCALEALSGDASPGSVLVDAYLTAAGARAPGRSRH